MLVLSGQHLKSMRNLRTFFGKQWAWLFYCFQQSVSSSKEEVNEIFWDVLCTGAFFFHYWVE